LKKLAEKYKKAKTADAKNRINKEKEFLLQKVTRCAETSGSAKALAREIRKVSASIKKVSESTGGSKSNTPTKQSSSGARTAVGAVLGITVVAVGVGAAYYGYRNYPGFFSSSSDPASTQEQGMVPPS